jgi:AcrR family transcriptional regulator
MGVAERRYRQKEEVRSLILDTAWKQIREEGVQALSIRKLAETIEYSAPVIYAHFESKDMIIKEFVQKGYLLLTERMEEASKKQTKPTQQLESMAEAYWQFACVNPEYYQLMFGLGIPSCETAHQVSEIKAFGTLVGSVIANAVAASKHPDTDVSLKFHTFWSILHGIISIRMNNCTVHSKEMSLAILKDAITGFLFALEG